MSRIAVLGASGPLGSCLVEHLLLGGHDVRALSRRAMPPHRLDVLAGPAAAVVGNVDHVVYAAWDTADRSPEAQDVHAVAAGNWARVCAEAGIGFVFLSTTLAEEGAGSNYGRAKLRAEDAVTRHEGVVLRVGLVVDDARPLLATRLRAMSRRTAPLAGRLSVPVFALSSAAVADAVASELGALRAGDRIWCAPLHPVPLGAVLTGRAGRPDGAESERLRPAGGLRPRPVLPGWFAGVGPFARHVDGLRGVLSGPRSAPDLPGPIHGPVPQDDWRRLLRVP